MSKLIKKVNYDVTNRSNSLVNSKSCACFCVGGFSRAGSGNKNTIKG